MVRFNIMLTQVAPYWGAWIEIVLTFVMTRDRLVAPYWGAWIEIISPFE